MSQGSPQSCRPLVDRGQGQVAGQLLVAPATQHRLKHLWVCRCRSAADRSILVIVWHLLADPQVRFHDLGPDFYDNRIGRERKKRNHIRQLEALDYKVTLEPAA